MSKFDPIEKDEDKIDGWQVLFNLLIIVMSILAFTTVASEIAKIVGRTPL